MGFFPILISFQITNQHLSLQQTHLKIDQKLHLRPYNLLQNDPTSLHQRALCLLFGKMCIFKKAIYIQRYKWLQRKSSHQFQFQSTTFTVLQVSIFRTLTCLFYNGQYYSTIYTNERFQCPFIILE